MANVQTPTSIPTIDIKSVLAETGNSVSSRSGQWRITNTAKGRKRGQIVAYADARAYADRLNALFSPKVGRANTKWMTMSNITRMKKGESIVSGKILVTCMVVVAPKRTHPKSEPSH